jgi:acetyl esterase/lipase
MISNPAYARQIGIAPGLAPEQLAGALLFCGVYDVSQMGRGGGILGWFIQSATWAYSGKRGAAGAAALASMSIIPNLTPAFPPAFISAGNADPLGPQSVALALALTANGTSVTSLFFAADHQPPLPHEYQFDLDTEAGRLALQRSTEWLARL